MKFSFGKNSGAYQDQDLTFVTHQGKPYRAMDMLNLINGDQLSHPLSNLDFLWPTIAVLGSFLDKHGCTFDYINQFHFEKEQLRQKLLKNEYLLVAITTTIYVTDFPIKDIVEFVRTYNKKVLIIAGGPYIKNRITDSSPPKLDLEFNGMGVDLVVNSSEGQMALVNVINALKRGQSLDGIDNIIYRKELRERWGQPAEGSEAGAPGGSSAERFFVFNGTKVEDNPLEENPVRFELFGPGAVGRFVSLTTAKSCPYACAFCSFPVRAGKYKYLEVGLVEHQLDRLKALGVDTVTFLDDTFNVPKPRFREMLRMMIRNQYNFKWNSFYRSDQGDRETIALMAESGCEGVFLGMESGSDTMLEKMNKTSRRRHYAEAIPLLREHGIYSHANMIIGFPGETPETVQETLDFLQTYQPDTYKAQLWYAETNTPVMQKKDELRLKGFGFNWSHHTMDSNQAAGWIDHIVREVHASAFLPQEGFGIWSIFYLQRLGMPRRQVLDFLLAFGAEVRRKRMVPEVQEISSGSLKTLFELGRIGKVLGQHASVATL
ncbi:radical SAM protein [Corallococcus llansteffanensis]|uniref:Radical SAM protein n=1 Tax=Corallococcus llansteffanensis TaxID=2316731 RepID=A0A3A8QI90_9BACT|nr:radical SAM protein [Corallococcus llansteffanensis]